ncbi:tRNA methyl transferase [Bacteriovorax sp. BAL6_X]|uniref:tRNA methyltransferase n=1 Tax=Bacteriovorax sp. BAL6_X TaxID=1201290 RepID=UPI0003854DD1|nr:tRNA methyltransferase [Bacteriovorax sp. BAL6_X]EPZ51353.1 tRNA methyl transferase [Bacteriovorax sp. BAL6_X]
MQFTKNEMKKERIIVGMDGGIDSAVTALLLKKQGHECIGVNISFFERITSDDELLAEQFKAKLTPEGKLPEELSGDEEQLEAFRHYEKIIWLQKINNIFAPWASESEEKIRDICRLIGIPFYVTSASSAFEQRVISKLLEGRIGGVWVNPSIDKATLVLETLHSKLAALKATRIATGHYCRVVPVQNRFVLSAPNDPEKNDCHLLTQASDEIMSYLTLPLADLKTSEVDKIGQLVDSKTISRVQHDKKAQLRAHAYTSEEIIELTDRYIARGFIKENTIYLHDDDSVIGEHKGQHQYYLGQTQYKTFDNKPKVPDSKIVTINMSRGFIYVAKAKELTFERIVGNHFVNYEVVDTSKPVECYCRISSSGDAYKGNLYLLNNGNIYFDLHDKASGILFRGDHFIFLTKNGPSAKVIGHARIIQTGQFIEGEFYRLPLNKKQKEQNEEAQSRPKKRELGF